MNWLRRALPLVIVAAVAAPVGAWAAAGFSDVPDDSPHVAGITYVKGAGITSGCTPSTYCPDQAVTRGQMATFLYRSSGNAPGVAPSVNAATLDGHTAEELMDDTTPPPTGPQVQAYGRVELNQLQAGAYNITSVRRLSTGAVCVAFDPDVEVQAVVISSVGFTQGAAPVFTWDEGCAANEIRVLSHDPETGSAEEGSFSIVVF